MSINNVQSTINLSSSLTLRSSELALNADIMRQYDVYITDAEIRGLDSSPVLLIPPSGSSTILALWKIILYPKSGGVVFAGGSPLICAYGNSGVINSVVSTSVPTDDFIQACFNNAQYQINGILSQEVSNQTLYEPYFNAGIYLTCPGIAYTGGTGTIILAKIWYQHFQVNI